MLFVTRSVWTTCLALALGASIESGGSGESAQDATSAIQIDELGTLAYGTRFSRSPVLVRRGDELWLYSASAAGVELRDWRLGDELGEPRPAEEDAPGWSELDLDRLPPPGVLVSSSRWRNGRLLKAGVPVGWSPSLARDAQGGAHVAFDQCDAGDYDVVLRAPGGSAQVVAGSDRMEAHAALALDGERAWLAWSVGERAWGRGGPLHVARELRLAVRAVDAADEGSRGVPPSEGAWREVALPSGLLAGATGRNSEGFSTAELPLLVADEGGVVWLLYRSMARWARIEAEGEVDAADGGSNRRVVWEIRAAALTDAGWIGPVTLPESDGAGYDGLAALPLPGGGVALCYESDARKRRLPRAAAWDEPLGTEQRLVAVELRAPGKGPSLESLGGAVLETGRSAPVAAAASIDPAPELVPPDWIRLWGDLHRHSDLSRCKMDLDGSALDQYRYAIDVAQLDFLALTEHFQHLTPGHWSYVCELAQRFTRPGEFAALFGFEQALANGHRNLLCADFDEALTAPFRDQEPERPLQAFPVDRWLAIPHQLADRQVLLQWSQHRPGIERLVEIYQSRRGSYEDADAFRCSLGAVHGHAHALDYLEEGRRFGFVAASDHIETLDAFTAVYARGRTREDVFEALRARRTYAATAKIALDVRLGALMLGEAGAVAPDAALLVRAAATPGIARVEIVRNGELAHAYTGDGAPLLSVRLAANGEQSLRLELRDARWTSGPEGLRGAAPALQREPDGAVVMRGTLDFHDEMGIVGAVELSSGAALELVRERSRETVALGELRLGEPVVRKVGNVRVEVRLDPPALGGESFEQSFSPGDWRPGDWVFARVVSTDGALAWSSPIWIEAEGEQ